MHSTTRVAYLVICRLVAATCLLSAVECAWAADNGDDRIRACAEGWRRNRESFHFATAKLRVTSGLVKSIDDAKAGKFTSDGVHDPVTTIATWIYDGPLFCCNESCKGLVETVTKPAGRRSMAPCWSKQYLSDGTYRLLVFVEPKGGGIGDSRKSRDLSWGYDNSPFSMAMMGGNEYLNPYHEIVQARAKQLSVKFQGQLEVEGRRAEVVTVDHGPYGLTRYYFDASRGYLVSRIDHVASTKQGLDLTGFLVDARECSRARWFPTRVVQIQGRYATTKLLGAWLIEVPELDVDHPPKPEAFALDLQQGLLISASEEPSAFFRLKAERHVAAKDLAGLCEETLKHKLPRAKPLR
ncbi:MAG TPA: hypothetical protein VGP63_26145 [Planctomycetaceae bacterium]|jgi:hypothetical protein|nr:hypothetical protein [Planctomycetaceae bacterium]